MGAPAARFIQRYRPQIFPTTPLLIAGADVRTVDDAALTPNDTAVTTALDLPRFIENIAISSSASSTPPSPETITGTS
jgi:hypothetical protein